LITDDRVVDRRQLLHDPQTQRIAQRIQDIRQGQIRTRGMQMIGRQPAPLAHQALAARDTRAANRGRRAALTCVSMSL